MPGELLDAEQRAFLVQSGFDPNGAVGFMTMLREEDTIAPHLVSNLLSTHPSVTSRLRYLRRRVRRLGRQAKPRSPSKEFLSLKRRYHRKSLR